MKCKKKEDKVNTVVYSPKKINIFDMNFVVTLVKGD